LRNFGGNIGYSVRPDRAQKGYATRMLKECLGVCRASDGARACHCIEGNEGSKRTILAHGGVYENTVFCERDNVTLERYWITL
jgi:predicted acetyltransferase